MSRCAVWIMIGLVFMAACNSQTSQTKPAPTPELIAMTILPSPAYTRTPRPSSPTPTLTATATQTSTPTVEPTLTPIPSATALALVELVVAVQPIPAGWAIPPEAVALILWPAEAQPFSPIDNLDQVINKVTLTNIGCFEPVIEEMLALRTVGTNFEPLPEVCPPLPVLQPPIETVNIIVASDYIAAGQTITPSMIAMRLWPQPFLLPGALSEFADVVGQVAGQNILREQPIYVMKLMPG